MKVEKGLNIKINDLKIELKRSIAEESKLKSSSIIKNKEFEQKMSEQQKKIESLQIAEQTFKNKEATIAVLRERLQANLNTFKDQKKANEQILDEKNDLESKIDFSNEDHSFCDSLSTVTPSPKFRNFVLKKTIDRHLKNPPKLSEKIKALEQSKKETSSLKGNITKIKNKHKESEKIIARIWDAIIDQGFL